MESKQRLNLSDILSFINTNARAAYLNKKELGTYYWRLLSNTTMMIRSNHMTQHEQSLIYLRGLPDLLHQQTTCHHRMKNLDRHPEDLPPIAELYDASAFCILGGGLMMTIANVPVPTAVPVIQAFPATVPSIFGMMAPSLTPVVLKKAGKPAARGACAAPPKKKTINAPPPAPPVPSLPTPQPTASTNSTPDMSAVTKIVPKPVVLQTIVPQIRSTNQKGKGKDAPGPDFHYQFPIEDKADAKVFDRILNVSIPITACELLSLSPDVCKQAKESTTTKKVKAATFIGIDPISQFLHSFNAYNCHDGLIITKESHALCSIVPIIDSCLSIECILDSGCQIIGMSHTIWMMLKSQLNPKHTVSMQSANGTVDRSLGIIENLVFCFGTIELQLQVHIIKDPTYDILLRCPFDVLTESSIKNYRNEDQTITITDSNDPSRVATMQTHPYGPPRFHTQKFQEGF